MAKKTLTDIRTEPAPAACDCASCVKACKVKPGWFAPGEAEKAAEFMGLGLNEFFAQYLMVDYWIGDRYDGDDIRLLSPAVTPRPRDGFAPFYAGGRCIFLTEDDRCSIHEVKPLECKLYRHDSSPDALHERIAQLWNTRALQASCEALMPEEER